MTEQVTNTPAEEVKQTEPTMSEVAGEVPTGEAKEETIGEALTQKKDDSVPLATFLDLKKSNKDLLKEMKELKKSIEEGATKKEVSSDLAELADRHNVDPDFLRDFAKAVRQQSESELEGKMEARLKPITDKERADKIDKAFSEHYTKAIENMPEYSDVVNRDVIKSLSLLPQNANKTFSQIIEDTYGKVVQGKRTIDSASTRAGKNDSVDVDMPRALKDQDYFKEVMGNPTLKKKYNDGMMKRIASQL